MTHQPNRDPVPPKPEAANPPDAPREESPIESTAALLERVRAGDEAARKRLVRRYLPALRRWAHGRLPAAARGMVDTDDLMQVALLRALHLVESFEPQRAGRFSPTCAGSRSTRFGTSSGARHGGRGRRPSRRS